MTLNTTTEGTNQLQMFAVVVSQLGLTGLYVPCCLLFVYLLSYNNPHEETQTTRTLS